MATELIKLIASTLLKQEEADFLIQIYMPEFQKVATGVQLSSMEKLSLTLKGVGTLLKLGYAFLWQEEVIPGPWLHSRELNALGGDAMSSINMIANALTGFPHPENKVQQ